MIRPTRIRGCVVGINEGINLGFDTVQRAWFRGEKLTRVVLKHRGACDVLAEYRQVVGEFKDLKTLCVRRTA